MREAEERKGRKRKRKRPGWGGIVGKQAASHQTRMEWWDCWEAREAITFIPSAPRRRLTRKTVQTAWPRPFSLYFPCLFSCPLLSLHRRLLFFSFWNSIPPLHTRGVPNEGREVPTQEQSLEPALVLAIGPAQGGNDGGKGAAKREKNKRTNESDKDIKREATRPAAWAWVNGGAPCCAIGGGPGGGAAYLDCRPAAK
ncbi:hypothetical protein LX32DRAFT_94168 [Colletotrichum zoysiae]|uniref:Uncharacterized protein n=1 Tax=Colletotrichum zoysiae TaxID=1216348 RepID=A0AAD9M0G3_9PEZI|nr:hypothetical protein LX32DRAFT_94168 [Colletotrichum zoysiae]